jgi:hypothetical protein
MNDPSPLIPKGAYLLRVSGRFKPISHGKRKLQLLDGLLGLVERVYGKSQDVDVLLFEFLNMGLKIGQLPITVRSPAAAIEDDYRILACEIPRKTKCPAIYGLDRVVRKDIANV